MRIKVTFTILFFLLLSGCVNVSVTRKSVNDRISESIIGRQSNTSAYPLVDNCRYVDFPESYKRVFGSETENVSVKDIAISTTGEIYLLEYLGIYNQKRDNYVSLITKDGDYLSKWSNPDFSIQEIKLDNIDRLYVFSRTGNSGRAGIHIYTIDDKGIATLFFSEENDLMSISSNIELRDTRTNKVFDQNNNLYISDNPFYNEEKYGIAVDDIKLINQERTQIINYNKVGQFIKDMKFDSLGNLFTLNDGDTNKGYVSISEVTTNGTVISEWVITNRGTNLVIDKQNNLYTAFADAVASYNVERNKIYKISPNGTVSKHDLDLPGKQSKSDAFTYLFIDERDSLYAYGSSLVGIYEINKDLTIKGLVWKPEKGYYGLLYPFSLNDMTYFMIREVSIEDKSRSNYKLIRCS